MNIIMYKSQAWDLTKCKSCMQYTPKRYWYFRFCMSVTQIFQGTTEAEDDGGRFLWNVGVQLQLYSVTVPKTTSCVLSILWTSKRTAYLYVFNQTVSDSLAFTLYRNFSFTVKGKKKVNRKYRSGSHELGCIWRESNCNLLIDCSLSAKINHN
jgi:hypothetical protein